MKKISTLLSAISCIFISSQITLVKDINPGTSNSNPASTIEYNGNLYFKANDGTNGTELWKSDGTTAGTILVQDYRAGSSSFNPQEFVVFDNKLFFQGNDGTNGAEVFTYNGTTISLFADLKVGAGSSVPQNFEVIGTNLYFKAQDPASTNNKIYKTNGTAAPAVIDATYNIAFGVDKLGTNLILSASPTTTYQLYKCDGTTFTLIKTINPSGSASPTNFYSDGTNVYFSADDGTNGKELWVTDGTTAGTMLLKDIAPAAAASSSPNNFFSFNSKIYFSANDGTNGTELWVTDGTTAGTTILKDINAAGNSNPSDFFAYNGKLFFTANDNTNGNELWQTDGTSAGTKLFLDINPGTGSSSPTDLTLYKGEVFINTTDGTLGKEFYKIDASVLATTNVITEQTNFYPNPSNGKLFSSSQKDFMFQVYDLKGALLKSGKSTGGKLDLNLPDGIYILKYSSDNKSAATKIVIKNK